MDYTQLGNTVANGPASLHRAIVGGRILQFDADFRMLRSSRPRATSIIKFQESVRLPTHETCNGRSRPH